MPTEIKSKKGLLKAHRDCSDEVRTFFEYIPKLIDEFPMHVCLAYVFSRMELGQNMALYCGTVKLFRANSEIAKSAVGTHHMTREEFVRLYKTIYGFDLPETAAKDLKVAERTRDLIMHGKNSTDENIRNAIARVLEYAEEVNTHLSTKFKIKPFGSLKGFSGRAKKLDKKTTRYMLKGMGFSIS
jgi:hypothetical protein